MIFIKYNTTKSHYAIRLLSFKLLSFDFSLKGTLTLLTMQIKTIHCKTENDTEKNLSPIQSKELAEISIFSSFHFL